MRKKVSISFPKKLGRWVVLKRKGGYDLWSRAVYQNFVLGGAEIPKGMVIHHKDGDCTNDRVENLEMIPRGYHAPVHHDGTFHTEETKRKIGNGNSGKIRTEETLKKLSISHIGKKRSPESIEKQRNSMLGRKNTPEHIEKVRQANLGKKRTLEQIERNRQAKKKNREARLGVI